MISHPPIPIHMLAEHIDSLKSTDNLKFSQEYESIEPGQQFTWDNSNLEINKPKNRYANVIAYDHSRVILQPLDGIPGSDYVNANYMDGYRKQNAYIATQVYTRSALLTKNGTSSFFVWCSVFGETLKRSPMCVCFIQKKQTTIVKISYRTRFICVCFFCPSQLI